MKSNQKSLIIAIIVNAFLGVIKLFGGIFMYSSALISEAVDSLMDVINNFVAMIAVNRSYEPADDEHPLGHGKYEYVGSLILGVVIVVVGVNLILSFAEVKDNVPLIEGIYILIGTTIVKFFLSRYLIKKGKNNDNQLIYALGIENQSDIYKSIVVFLGIILSVVTDFTILGLSFDSIAAIIIGLYIVKTGFVILIESRDNILGQSASSEIYASINKLIEKTEGVLGIGDLKIIKFGPYYQVLASIIVDKDITVDQGHSIASVVKENILTRNDIAYVLVHVDPNE